MIKEYSVVLSDGTKEYVVELTDEPDKVCVLEQFIKSLDFVLNKEEFKIVDLQKYLKCGYGTVCKVLDALCTICAIEIKSGPPNTIYKSRLKGG